MYKHVHILSYRGNTQDLGCEGPPCCAQIGISEISKATGAMITTLATLKEL